MDTVDRATRSRIMSRIRSRGTGPEAAVARALRAAGAKGWRRHRRILGIEADFSFASARLVVRVQGCFWHAHRRCRPRVPSTNRLFWARKLARNAERDRAQARTLRRAGWRVLDVWECGLAGVGRAAARIAAACAR